MVTFDFSKCVFFSPASRYYFLIAFLSAIKFSKDKVPLLREKLNLLKSMGEENRALLVKKMLLKYLPDNEGDEYLQLAREMTKV